MDPGGQVCWAQERGEVVRLDHRDATAPRDPSDQQGLGVDSQETVPDFQAAVQWTDARSCVFPFTSVSVRGYVRSEYLLPGCPTKRERNSMLTIMSSHVHAQFAGFKQLELPFQIMPRLISRKRGLGQKVRSQPTGMTNPRKAPTAWKPWPLGVVMRLYSAVESHRVPSASKGMTSTMKPVWYKRAVQGIDNPAHANSYRRVPCSCANTEPHACP